MRRSVVEGLCAISTDHVCAVTTLKLNGENVPYEDIRKAIEEVSGVITTGLFMDITTAAIFPRGDEAKIIEKVQLHNM